MADLREFAQLPEEQRRRTIEQDLAAVAGLEQHPFKNRKAIKESTPDLVIKVNGHTVGLVNALIDQSLVVDITDPQATDEFDIAGGKEEWFRGFWGSTFKSILQAVLGAKNDGRFGDADAARRLHYLNETTYRTSQDYLKTRGWDEGFGPHVSAILHQNLEVALSAPRGEKFVVQQTGPPTDPE